MLWWAPCKEGGIIIWLSLKIHCNMLQCLCPIKQMLLFNAPASLKQESCIQTSQGGGDKKKVRKKISSTPLSPGTFLYCNRGLGHEIGCQAAQILAIYYYGRLVVVVLHKWKGERGAFSFPSSWMVQEKEFVNLTTWIHPPTPNEPPPGCLLWAASGFSKPICSLGLPFIFAPFLFLSWYPNTYPPTFLGPKSGCSSFGPELLHLCKSTRPKDQKLSQDQKLSSFCSGVTQMTYARVSIFWAGVSCQNTEPKQQNILGSNQKPGLPSLIPGCPA